MKDFVVGEFAGDGDFPEIAAVTSFPLPHPLILISDIDFSAFRVLVQVSFSRNN